MKLQVSFQRLVRTVYQMGVKELVEFDLHRVRKKVNLVIKPIETTAGLEVDPYEVIPHSKSGVLTYNNQHVLLFIPDHSYGTSFEEAKNDPQKGNRFHLTDCKTLSEMKARNRFKRYYVTTNKSGYFTIFNRQNENAEVRLAVCKNCLNKLNYWVSPFNLEQFFEHYSTDFISLPTNVLQEPMGTYTLDWKRISEEYRKARHYQCENCRVNLTQYKHLLHTHHIDGNKAHNAWVNLKAVCEECHAKEDFHGHMPPSLETLNLLKQLRLAQGLA